MGLSSLFRIQIWLWIFFLAGTFARAEQETGSELPCNEPSGPVLAEDSPSIGHFEALLKKGEKAPLDEFMQLWYPDRPGASEDTDKYLKGCVQETRCVLDTVYRWGSAEKLQRLQASLPDNAKWTGGFNNNHGTYTLASAIGSYGYGLIPIRIKLKPGVTVGVIFDHFLNNKADVESWSFGTPEHYDEIVRDYRRFKSGGFWIGYPATYTLIKSPTGKAQLFFPKPLDGKEFSERALKLSLLEMIRTILQGRGRIYFSEGACRNRESAFQTAYPTFINPFSSAGSQHRSP